MTKIILLQENFETEFFYELKKAKRGKLLLSLKNHKSQKRKVTILD